MAKKKKYQKKDFESTGESYDVSANIYLTMIESEAWESLTKNQRLLYVYMKMQYYSQKRKPIKDNKASFYFNQTKWLNEYELYSEGNKASFYKDCTSLIEKGFINCVSSGSNTRTRSVYEFSSRWQKYKKEGENKIETKYMNLTLLRKNKKKDIQ